MMLLTRKPKRKPRFDARRRIGEIAAEGVAVGAGMILGSALTLLVIWLLR